MVASKPCLFAKGASFAPMAVDEHSIKHQRKSGDKLVILGMITPFLGTSLGAAAVFFMKRGVHERRQALLLGFASGVMTAAAVWSLLLPAIARAGEPKWLSPSIGFVCGCAFLAVCETLSDALQQGRSRTKHSMMFLAVTLHNIPEGMAVGVAFAAALNARTHQALAAAFVLALGIAIQNFPEGAIIALPLHAQGVSKPKAFLFGTLSGVVEPVGAVLTLWLTAAVEKVLALLLSAAAGAMVYVCVNELIPASKHEGNGNCGVLGFGGGFLVMMILDVALG